MSGSSPGSTGAAASSESVMVGVNAIRRSRRFSCSGRFRLSRSGGSSASNCDVFTRRGRWCAESPSSSYRPARPSRRSTERYRRHQPIRAGTVQPDDGAFGRCPQVHSWTRVVGGLPHAPTVRRTDQRRARARNLPEHSGTSPTQLIRPLTSRIHGARRFSDSQSPQVYECNLRSYPEFPMSAKY